MGLGDRIIVCGAKRALMGMALRFLGGPAVFAAASYIVGLRGVSLNVAIVQVFTFSVFPSSNAKFLDALLFFTSVLSVSLHLFLKYWMFLKIKVSWVQAALPQGIVPFVFAKEYNVHPEILSTA